MKNAKLLLEKMSAILPPGENQRHNITLDSSGDLELCLMIGDKYYPVTFENNDLERGDIDVLVDEIFALINAERYGIS